MIEPLHIIVFFGGWVAVTILLVLESRWAWQRGYRKALLDMLDANTPKSVDDRWSPTVVRLVHQLLGQLDESTKKAESADQEP